MSTISEVVPEPGVTLRGGDLPWQPVSTRLVSVRLLLAATLLGVALAAAIAVALLVTPWVWWAAGALVLAAAWLAWLVPRQVTAISWVELDEELVIRKGRLWRTLVSVPYGRLQYVDLHSGPLLRAFGLASIEIHTASPASGGRLSGLLIADAEALRARLAARGESQRAGL